jgi:hypothetical protein
MSLDIYFTQVAKCPHCGKDTDEGQEVHWQNITHNLSMMASAAGFGDHLWNPEDAKVKTARDLIVPIESGIYELKQHPEKYIPLSASNGWGTYEQFIPWLEELLTKCREYPEAKISVSV